MIFTFQFFGDVVEAPSGNATLCFLLLSLVVLAAVSLITSKVPLYRCYYPVRLLTYHPHV